MLKFVEASLKTNGNSIIHVAYLIKFCRRTVLEIIKLKDFIYTVVFSFKKYSVLNHGFDENDMRFVHIAKKIV